MIDLNSFMLGWLAGVAFVGLYVAYKARLFRRCAPFEDHQYQAENAERIEPAE